MLKLYHGNTSVCSQKARVALAEKDLEWESALLNLGKDEHMTPAYLKLNPDAVVPTLVHDGMVVRESSVIIEYLDRLSDNNPLMPAEREAENATRLWLIRAIAIHEAINTMTFATFMREREAKGHTQQEVEAKLARLKNPQVAAKRRDLFAKGVESVYVDGALSVLNQVFIDMEAALRQHRWLAGDTYSLADITLIAYIDRLDRLGMKGLWVGRFPSIDPWLRASQARPSYETAILKFIPPGDYVEAARAAGSAAWPGIARRLS